MRLSGWTNHEPERFAFKNGTHEETSIMSKLTWTKTAFLAAAACLMTASASAQQPYLAKFTLPMEAHFGNSVLHPGEYSIYRVVGMDAIRITGEGGTATVLAASADRAAADRSTITLENVGGVFAVKRLDS